MTIYRPLLKDAWLTWFQIRSRQNIEGIYEYNNSSALYHHSSWMWCSVNKNILYFIKIHIDYKIHEINFFLHQYSVIWKTKNKHQCYVKYPSRLTKKPASSRVANLSNVHVWVVQMSGAPGGTQCRKHGNLHNLSGRDGGVLNPQPFSCTAPQYSSELFIHNRETWDSCWTCAHTLDIIRCPDDLCKLCRFSHFWVDVKYTDSQTHTQKYIDSRSSSVTSIRFGLMVSSHTRCVTAASIHSLPLITCDGQVKLHWDHFSLKPPTLKAAGAESTVDFYTLHVVRLKQSTAAALSHLRKPSHSITLLEVQLAEPVVIHLSRAPPPFLRSFLPPF